MSKVTIKPVIIKDYYSTISEMMDGLHANERSLNKRTAQWKEIESNYMQHITDMQEEQGGLMLIAYVGNKPAGFIFGYTEEDDDSRIEESTGNLLYVSDGYVYPEYRKKGIYKLLNQHLEQHFVSQGIKRICRYTLINNHDMQRFLERAGYATTRLLYEKWL